MSTKLALVTGASSGLGIALARDLADRGYDLVLTARSEAPMQALAAELSATHGVTITVIPCDLSEPGSAAGLVQALDERNLAPDVLVNNAAFGLSEDFMDHAPDRLTSMIQLNVTSLSELTLLIGRRMRTAGRGHILLVSSTAAYQPTPSMSAYGATKVFILALGEALKVELAPTVDVTVLAPGVMNTGFNVASGYQPTPTILRFLVDTDRVAKEGLDGLFEGRSSVVPGRWNVVAAFSNRFRSRHAAARLFYKVSRGQ